MKLRSVFILLFPLQAFYLFPQKLYPVIEDEKFFSLVGISGKKIKGPFELTDKCIYNDCSQMFSDRDLRTIDPYLRFKQNNKIGVVNNQGTVLINPVYDTVIDIGRCKEFYAILSVNGKQGVMDSSGAWHLKANYNKITSIYQSTDDACNLFFTCLKDTLWGLTDKNGKEIIPFSYTAPIERFGYTSMWLVKQVNGYGLYSNDGKLIIEPVYESISYKDDGDAYGGLSTPDQQYYGFINTEGKLLLPPDKNATFYFPRTRMFQVSDANY